jgi:hypothetical protein
MMTPSQLACGVYLACGYSDMRKGTASLAMMVQQVLAEDPFGRRSEQLSRDKLQLGLEDLEWTIAESEAMQDAAGKAAEKQSDRRCTRPNRNHGALPAHLPRYEVMIDIDDRTSLRCGGCAGSHSERSMPASDPITWRGGEEKAGHRCGSVSLRNLLQRFWGMPPLIVRARKRR